MIVKPLLFTIKTYFLASLRVKYIHTYTHHPRASQTHKYTFLQVASPVRRLDPPFRSHQ